MRYVSDFVSGLVVYIKKYSSPGVELNRVGKWFLKRKFGLWNPDAPVVVVEEEESNGAGGVPEGEEGAASPGGD